MKLLRSMRARLTLTFVFVLAPFLIGASHLVILANHRHHDDDRTLHLLFILSGTAVFAFGIASWLLIGRTLSPIRALAQQASTASAEDTGIRLTSPSRDGEMLELVSTLNEFLGRMEEASEQKTRFYAAASHELRTPLQALSGHLEVALGQQRTAKEYRSTIAEALTQTQRLVTLTEGILLLHQLQGPGRAEGETVSLSNIVEEVLDSLQPLIEARGLRSQAQVDEDVTVQSIPSHAHVLVRNLLENAAKYGNEGGVLGVRVNRDGVLQIQNELPPGSNVDANRLFEPFYRLDASRSTKSGGNGMGLAICMAVAKANKWVLNLHQEGSSMITQVEFNHLKGRP